MVVALWQVGACSTFHADVRPEASVDAAVEAAASDGGGLVILDPSTSTSPPQSLYTHLDLGAWVHVDGAEGRPLRQRPRRDPVGVGTRSRPIAAEAQWRSRPAA